MRVQEGSSYNKAVEIYNPMGSAVMLSGYMLGKTVNGGSMVEYNMTFAAGVMIAGGGTYTVCNSRIATTYQPQCDILSSFISHNGDDVYMIIEIASDSILDTFGALGPDVGSAFSVCGDARATQDNTLVRKPSVVRGNPDWSMQNGTNASNCEWLIRPLNDFTNGGEHACVRPTGTLFFSEMMVRPRVHCQTPTPLSPIRLFGAKIHGNLAFVFIVACRRDHRTTRPSRFTMPCRSLFP
jgi:hypothetical protein